MTNNDDVEKLCQSVLEALPRLAADPSLTLMERRFVEEMQAVVAEKG